MNCQGCLKEIEGDTLCKKCRKEIFTGKKISTQLDFASPEKGDSEALMKNAQRISISGVQTKYSLKREGNKLVLTEAGGHYILKPTPIGLFQNMDQMPANEHLTMQIARQIYGIKTAACAIVFFNDGQTSAYLTKRFDVKEDESRYQQEDFAQLAQLNEKNSGENYKYNYSYEEAAELIQKYVAAYRAEMERFFKLVLFNYLFQNGDAHLKNFSVYRTEDGDYLLTPAYDLMNTKVHIPNDPDLALGRGLFKGDFVTESYEANGFLAYDDFLEFGKRIGIKETRTQRIIESFIGSQMEVEDMVQKSFLTEDIKPGYFALFMDKHRAISYSFSGRREQR